MNARSALFENRRAGGRELAKRLVHFDPEETIVLGLARGGVIVAEEVAKQLGAPLDVVVARKLGAPRQPELGMGAIAPGGVVVLDEHLIGRLGVAPLQVQQIVEREEQEMQRRLAEYRLGKTPLDLEGKSLVLVDDGLATGVTAIAAARSLRMMRPKRLVAAFPVCSLAGSRALEKEVDEVVCLASPQDLYAVGMWYEDFSQIEDGEVIEALLSASTSTQHLSSGLKTRDSVRIATGEAVLTGDLVLPEGAAGIVLFAHGSGSGRMSPRNRYVASKLNAVGFATLLVDLLTREEEAEDQYSSHLRFNIGLLADRLSAVTDWMTQDPDCSPLPFGYFGASTGAAAALTASVRHPNHVKAIVSRGGRPDLAGANLNMVSAATLLIVGTKDVQVMDLNRLAFQEIGTASKALKPVEGATHLFEEPGALEQVAELTQSWFLQYL